MNKTARIILTLLRVSIGGLFFYAGITKILNPEWSAAGYISNSTILPDYYAWLSTAPQIDWVNILNKWGLLLIGVSLMLGLLVRFSAPLGALLMFLYYLPTLNFPLAGEHSYIVDDHVIYIFVLLFFTAVSAGRYYGIDKIIQNKRK
jgi:thiosulfate dehydrogenase [quinone] large subunit